MAHVHPIVNPEQDGGEDPGEGVAEEEIREGAVGGEDEEDPGEAGAADGEEGDDGGADAVAVAAQGGGEGVADGAEEAEGDDVLDACLREADDLGIAGEIGKDCVHGEEREYAVEERDDDGEGEAERGGAAAAREIARAVVLPDEGGAGLVDGEDAVVEENLDGEGRGGGGHDLFAEAVDGCLEHEVCDVEHHTLCGGGEADRADAPEDGEAAGDAQEARLEAQYAALLEQALD